MADDATSWMISMSGLSSSSIATFIADVMTVIFMLGMQRAKACTVVPEAMTRASCGERSSTAAIPILRLASGRSFSFSETFRVAM